MRTFRYIISLLLILGLGTTGLQAQNRRIRNEGNAYGKRIEKKVVEPDSIAIARRDSIHKADSLFRQDSLELLSKSSLTAPAFSTAKDSIIEDFSNGQRKIYYYGDVSVKSADMELTAAYMEYDMNAGTVYAKGVYDSVAGEWIGRPIMKQGSKEYKMEEVRYNFNSQKARITNMLTNEDEGILQGRNIKMMPDQSINLTNGKYTVCDAEHPHYYLHLTSAKVIRDPDQKTIFGPAYMVVEDVKLPFVGLPFGFIPKRPERATGLLMPTFGEEQARGFYFRDLGMYFVFGDHFDLSVTGDYYTLGSWAIDINSRYRVNYKFNGGFGLTYSMDQIGEKNSPDFQQSRNFVVKWNHSQDSKAHPGSTFSASVNFSSPSNNRYNATSLNDALQNQINSSISYTRNFDGKFNFNISMRHNQNSRDSSYTFTLPNISFSMSTIYPFKQKNRVGKEKFYEKFSIGYSTRLQNSISFKASEFEMTPKFFNKFKNGMDHTFNIGLPSFQLMKYININPSVSYGQTWYFRKQEYVYNPETDKPEKVLGDQFGTLGIAQNYSFSTSMSTRLYGMFNFGKHSKLQTLRHVVSPSLSISLSPEKGTHANGYRTLSYVDKNGQAQTYNYNIYDGLGLSNPPGKGKSATASLSITNNLEAKVRDYADTTGTGTKKVKLIDQLTLRTSYNFLAEQFKMQVISMNMSTRLFDKVSISSSASFDPYAIDEKGVRIDKFALKMGQGLARFKTFNASASYSISGEGKIEGNDGRSAGGEAPRSQSTSSGDYYQRQYYHPVTGEFIPDGWLYYENPNAPWSVNLSANFSINRGYNYDKTLEQLLTKDVYVATFTVSGNIQLTPKLSIQASSGYDFIAKQITSTSLNANYDLHCFNISVQWIPIGMYKSYSFRIAANAATLADLLKFQKRDSYMDNR